jgi:D-serine deaminase-like pyridoxal phosphate-dependent protein
MMTMEEPADYPSKSDPFGTDHAAGQLRLEHFATPIATIAGERMAANIAAMARWCAERGLSLSPHGKTTMAPAIWRQQLDAGAWAITVATPAQLRIARMAGIPRVLVANEIVDPLALRWLYAELEADPDWQVICWVDSLASVEAMAAQHDGSSRPIEVCVEIGAVDTRAGARSLATARAVAVAARSASAVRLVGISGYEGVVTEGADATDLAQIDGYLEELVAAHLALSDLYEGDEVLLSAGGSAYFDLVEARLGPLAGTADGRSARVVLRPGVYVVHDDGLYEHIAPHSRGEGPELVAALHVWGRVLSRPQPGLVLVDVGRRDISADVGMPVAQRVQRDGEWLPDSVLDGVSVFELNDQHAFLRVAPESPIAVGDVVRFGLSHPCTTFDKWSAIPVIDDPESPNPRVTEFIRTRF